MGRAPYLPIGSLAMPGLAGQAVSVPEIEWDADRRLIVVSGPNDDPDDEWVPALGENLFDLMNAREIRGITSIRNESTDDVAVLTVELHRNADADAILNVIKTQLSTGDADAS